MASPGGGLTMMQARSDLDRLGRARHERLPQEGRPRAAAAAAQRRAALCAPRGTRRGCVGGGLQRPPRAQVEVHERDVCCEWGGGRSRVCVGGDK